MLRAKPESGARRTRELRAAPKKKREPEPYYIYPTYLSVIFSLTETETETENIDLQLTETEIETEIIFKTETELKL